jgi:hypothetical protein
MLPSLRTDCSSKKTEYNSILNRKGSDDGVQHSELLGSWTLSIVRNSIYQKTQRVGNCICFRCQVKGKTPTQLGLLERANHCASSL